VLREYLENEEYGGKKSQLLYRYNTVEMANDYEVFG
jgi:hypothetical protein